MIYLVGADGGKPRRLTGEGFRDIRPSFSADGKWIYFSSNRSGRIEVWKVPAGGGTPQQVTQISGNEPFESPDGKFLYFVNNRGLWSAAVAGGAPKLVLPDVMVALYAVAGRSIYYAVRNPPGLWVLRTDTGRKFEYVRLPKNEIALDIGSILTVSADEQTIMYAQMDRQESDLMLVENFK
jgi:WD40-like Beta Propeller Repeat